MIITSISSVSHVQIKQQVINILDVVNFSFVVLESSAEHTRSGARAHNADIAAARQDRSEMLSKFATAPTDSILLEDGVLIYYHFPP